MKGAYMKVENVLKYLQNVTKLNKRVLGLKQYKIEGEQNHFFKCEDLAEMIGARLFRVMECEVVQLLII
jgi:hypothetical protein